MWSPTFLWGSLPLYIPSDSKVTQISLLKLLMVGWPVSQPQCPGKAYLPVRLPRVIAKAQAAGLGCTGQNKCQFPPGPGYPGLGEKAGPCLSTASNYGHSLCTHTPKHSQGHVEDTEKKKDQSIAVSANIQ